MPDIPLGTALNNHTGKTTFSQFRGKLVILDFWDSYCSSCIENFPHMVELQKKFGDRIQIMLVNHEETQDEIEQSFSRNPNYKNRNNLIPSELISIVSKQHGDNKLNTLFPPIGRVTGYHVWISSNGIVVLRGMGLINTNEKKIQEALSGKKVSYISDDGAGVADRMDVIPPFYTFLPTIRRPVVEYSSTVTKFLDEISGWHGTRRIIIDSLNRTVKSSYLNFSILDLYLEAIESIKFKLEHRENLNQSGATPLLLTADSSILSRYTKYSSIENQLSEEWYRKYAYCYEQIVPWTYSEALRLEYMLEDLNRYFGNLMGIRGQVESKLKPCLLFTVTDAVKKYKSSEGRVSKIKVNQNGKTMSQYKGMSLHSILSDIISVNKEVLTTDKVLPMIDEMNYKESVDLLVPEKIRSVDQLVEVLKPYGIGVTKSERKISRLVISDQKK